MQRQHLSETGNTPRVRLSENKLEAAKDVIKGYNSRGNKVRCLSPIHRPVHCTAWLSKYSCITVTAHTSQALAFTFTFFLFFVCFTWSGGCVCKRVGVSVCASCRNLQPGFVSSMEPLYLEWSWLVQVRGRHPHPHLYQPLLLCFVTGMSQLSDQSLKQQRFRSFEKGGGPQHDSKCIAIFVMSSICCMSCLPNNFLHVVQASRTIRAATTGTRSCGDNTGSTSKKEVGSIQRNRVQVVNQSMRGT